MKRVLPITKRTARELFTSHTEKLKAPKALGGIVFCKGCKAVYYRKAWHPHIRFSKKLHKDLPVRFMMCPACAMIRARQFEGEIIVHDVPVRLREELVRFSKHFGDRAQQRNPLSRVADVYVRNGTLRITTTDNQLAVKLAKHIVRLLKRATHTISYSSAPSDVVYIRIAFRG